MAQLGRIIFFDKKTGRVIFEMGESQGEVSRESIGEVDFIQLPFGEDSDKFARVKSMHINPETKEVVFDELYNPVLTPKQQIQQLQDQLLLSENQNVEGGIF